MLFALLLTVSCVEREQFVPDEPVDKVDIVFGVDMPAAVGTKAMAELPQVQNLRVAVFGGSGYLKEYVQADPIQLATTNGTRYTYRVTLSLTDSHVKIHFIANGPETIPFRYEDEVMSTLMVSGTQDAYWQRIEIPEGITAKKDSDDNYIKVDGKFVVTDETKAHFQDIPLVRNFACIEVTTSDAVADEQFELESYAVINEPSAGSIAAYNRNSFTFVENYQDSTFAQIKASYTGNMPAAATIDGTMPADHNDPAFSANPKYVYERPVPTSNATFIIVYGKYIPENKYCYYKIDLMDSNGYYALYRNFKYKVNITNIQRAGSDSPENAANAAGSGDVSTLQEAESLTDVSDGTARIFVEYTEKTLVGQGTVTLLYKFIPDVNNDTPANSNNETLPAYVKVTVGDAGTTGAVIDGNITVAASDDAQGWRKITFNTTTPGELIKSQTITVTGYYKNGLSRIFRKVNYYLMGTQQLDVVCSPKDLEKGKNQEEDILIRIPKDLPRSIFPIQFKIEADNNSLNPLNDNMPVYAGTSIKDGTSNAYYFIKSVSYEDYLALQEAAGSDDYVTVTAHFKTTKVDSDSNVYVTADYFNTDHDNFYTYTIHNFSSLAFSNYAQAEPDLPVTFSFSMDPTDIPEKVILNLTGLKPVSSSTLVQIAPGAYEYYTHGNSTASIALLTSTDDGYYAAAISAAHYNDASIDNLYYVNPRFTASQVPMGKNKPVEFKFGYVPGVIEPVTFTLNNLVPDAADSRFTSLGSGQYLFTPNNEEAEQTIVFKTTQFARNVSVTSMTGETYHPAGPFNLSAPVSFTVDANVIEFEYSDSWIGTYGPGNNDQITVYNSNGQTVGSFTVTTSGGYRRNSGSFTINYADLESEYLYFSFDRGLFYSTYYVGPFTVDQLDNATTSSRIHLSESSYTTTRPW